MVFVFMFTEKTGPDWATDFSDFFSQFLGDMAPQNRRAFKNIIFFLNESITQVSTAEQAQIYPAFVNLLHLEEEDEASEEINYDPRYLRTISFLAMNSEELFDGKYPSLWS